MTGVLEPVAVGPRPTDPEAVRYVRSYLILRVVVGALGIALPFLLVLVDGLLFDGDPFPRGSLSSYYYSGAREFFVGGLSAIGIFLLTYKVAERNLDNTMSSVAGIAVIIVALFPTRRAGEGFGLMPLQELLGETTVSAVHFIFATIFIGSLAVISYQFGKREGRREQVGERSPLFWRRYHYACAGTIVAAIAWIVVTELLGEPDKSLLIGEAVSVWAFGASWLMKGLELDLLRGLKS